MTVSELIAELQKMPQNGEVRNVVILSNVNNDGMSVVYEPNLNKAGDSESMAAEPIEWDNELAITVGEILVNTKKESNGSTTVFIPGLNLCFPVKSENDIEGVCQNAISTYLKVRRNEQ